MNTQQEMSAIHQILPYHALSKEVQSLVDADVAKLQQMSGDQILYYGWDRQERKNKLLNEAMTGFDTISTKQVDEVLDQLMDSQKSVIPRKRGFFRKAYTPTASHKRQFAGKVGSLEDILNGEVAKIVSSNDTYVSLIKECKTLVDDYAICMMAIDRYLDETDDVVLRDALERKKKSLATARISNIQSAIMYMKLYQNNGLLVNQLQEVIHVNLPQLQEQVLIQSGVSEIKNALKQCKDIKDSIHHLAENNVSDLHETGKMIENGFDDPSAQDAEKKMSEVLSLLKGIKDEPKDAALPESVEANEEVSKAPQTNELLPASTEPEFKVVSNEKNQWNYQKEDGSFVSDEWFYKVEPFAEGFGLVTSVSGHKNYLRADGTYLFEEWLADAHSFREGFACVAFTHGQYTFINHQGIKITEKIFYEVPHDFCENVAAVKVDGGYNFLTREGNLLCKHNYYDVGDFHDGIAKVINNDYDISFIKADGKRLTLKWFHSTGEISEGFVCVREIIVNKVTLAYKEHYNYLKTDGTFLCKKWFGCVHAYSFHEQRALIKLAYGRNGYNYLKPDGTLLLRENLDEADCFYNGLAIVRTSDGWNYLKLDGTYLCNQWYKEIRKFHGEYAVVLNHDGMVNVINKNGHPVLKSWYNDFYYDLDSSHEMPVIEEGFVIAKRNDGRWNFVSLETGEPLDSKWYEDVHFLGKVDLVQREDGISS